MLLLEGDFHKPNISFQNTLFQNIILDICLWNERSKTPFSGSILVPKKPVLKCTFCFWKGLFRNIFSCLWKCYSRNIFWLQNGHFESKFEFFILQFYSFFYFIVLVLVCIEDDYFNKMSDEVDMDMDDTVKNEDCSKIFTTMKVIISSL